MKIWLLTSEFHYYDQQGVYFEAVFKNKPTVEQLVSHQRMSVNYAECLLARGMAGKEEYGETTFILEEIDCD